MDEAERRQAWRHLGLPATWVAIPATSVTGPMIGGRVLLLGWAVMNAVSSSQQMFLRDGTDGSGPVIIPMTLPSFGNSYEWFGDKGVLFEIGVHATFTATTWQGSIFVVPLREQCDDYDETG